MPSRPVVAPYSTTRLPGPCAFADWSRPESIRPTHIALTRQLPAYASWKTVAPPTFGTPTQLP